MPLDLLILATTCVLAVDPDRAGTRPLYAAPVSGAPSFNPLPEMWGLREVGPETRLEALDRSLVLYLSERASLAITDPDGRIWFSGGRQLLTDGALSESDVAAFLRSHACLCALEVEGWPSGPEVETAAGAYHLAAAPALSRDASGVQRLELRLVDDGASGRARLRGLACWTACDTVAPLTSCVPGFAVLATKQNSGFADPPRDERPIRKLVVDASAEHSFSVTLGEQYSPSASAQVMIESWFRPDLNAPELTGWAEPGLTSLLRAWQTGWELPVDNRGYYRDPDPTMSYIDRLQGVHFRESCFWP